MATHVYARNADGSLSMHNRFVRRVGGPATSLDETYRFDPAAQTWKLSITGTPFFGRFEGAAAPWTGDAWIFAGSESLPAPNGFLRRDEVQLVYVDRFPDGFERDFFANVGGRWVPYSDESCTRSPSSG